MLKLASKLFSAVTKLRSFASEFGITSSYSSKLPVICIGNAVVGGAGKTPVVRWLCAELSARGYTPVVLSRGYKGSETGPYECQLTDLAAKIGDEPALLVRSGCKVVVSKVKIAGVKFIENGLGDVIVLDDGYQHLRLARDCNVLLIPASSKVTDLTFPAGRLRESYHTALSRADVALISHKSNFDKKSLEALSRNIAELAPALPIANSTYTRAVMIDSKGAAVKDLYEACLVTAVADPQGVRATAMAAGVNVLCEKLFPDHHKFKAEEIKEIERTSKLPLLVTEKDAVKLFDLGLTNFFILRVDVEIRGPLLEVALARISGKTRQAAEQSLLCNQILEASPLKRQKLAQLRRVSRDLHGKILDLGSDNGAVSFALRRLGGDWQTGDLDSEVIAGASYFLGDSVREINPSKLQFLNAELDAVVVLDMFEHLQDDKALRDELLRVLKPGGQLIVNVPNPHIGLIRLLRTILGQTDKVHGHVRPGYTPDELKKVLGPEFNIEVVLEYSRAFTELADTLVTLGVDLLKSAKRSSAKGRVVSAGNLTAFRKTIKLGRLVAPLLNLAVLFDYLLPWTHTNLLIVRARKL